MKRFSGRWVRAAADDARDLVAYRAAIRAGDAAEEERLAEVLLDRNPTDHVMLFDLALAAKRRRDWAEAAALNERALAVMSKTTPGEPAAWNLGIAATALGDWPRARTAWRTFGIEVPDDGPMFPDGLGPVPVRLNPTGTQLGEAPLQIDGTVHEPEVVWSERLSPAHARVVSVPSGESGHRWGDVVLTDGVPHGERFDGHGWVRSSTSLRSWNARVTRRGPPPCTRRHRTTPTTSLSGRRSWAWARRTGARPYGFSARRAATGARGTSIVRGRRSGHRSGQWVSRRRTRPGPANSWTCGRRPTEVGLTPESSGSAERAATACGP